MVWVPSSNGRRNTDFVSFSQAQRIDIIGMPLTPFSYAGAARRAWRRGLIAPAAYYAPAAYLSASYPLLRPDSGPLRLPSHAPARRLVSGGPRANAQLGLILRRDSRWSKV